MTIDSYLAVRSGSARLQKLYYFIFSNFPQAIQEREGDETQTSSGARVRNQEKGSIRGDRTKFTIPIQNFKVAILRDISPGGLTRSDAR